MEILDPNFPSVEERRADFIARLKDGTIIHVEIQIHYDPNLPERLVEYSVRIKRVYGSLPIQIILWIGEGEAPYKEEMRVGNVNFKCKIIDLKQIDCSIFLDSDDPNDNILAVFCKRNEGFWNKLGEKLMKLSPTDRQNYLRKLFYLSRLRKDALKEYEILRKEVEEMPIVYDIEQDPFYVMGIEKGIQEGIEKGLQQGIEKGLILDAQELVIEALEVKFLEVDDDLKRLIGSINNRDTLKMLHRLAIQVQSLEEFKKKMVVLI